MYYQNVGNPELGKFGIKSIRKAGKTFVKWSPLGMSFRLARGGIRAVAPAAKKILHVGGKLIGGLVPAGSDAGPGSPSGESSEGPGMFDATGPLAGISPLTIGLAGGAVLLIFIMMRRK